MYEVEYPMIIHEDYDPYILLEINACEDKKPDRTYCDGQYCYNTDTKKPFCYDPINKPDGYRKYSRHDNDIALIKVKIIQIS